jgi:integrase
LNGGDRQAPRIKQIREKQKRPEFYDFEQYDRLVLAAEAHPNPMTLLVVLLGGEAGLRVGEILGLQWSDVDFRAGAVHINRSISHVKNAGEAGRDVVGSPKGGRARSVPMPDRLRDALRAHRKVGDCSVITNPRGEQARKYVVEDRLYDCQEAAGFPHKGPHILRHYAGRRIMPGGSRKAPPGPRRGRIERSAPGIIRRGCPLPASLARSSDDPTTIREIHSRPPTP